MSKQKTRKSAVRRFKLTKTGKLLRRKQHGRHLKSNKKSGQKRRAKRIVELKGKFKSKIKKMLAAS